MNDPSSLIRPGHEGYLGVRIIISKSVFVVRINATATMSYVSVFLALRLQISGDSRE